MPDPLKPPAPLPSYIVFSTAGISGICAWCVIHPFNTIAVRRSLASQGANAAATEVSLSQFVQTIVREEGAASLYNGLSAGCARQLVYMSARIGFYEKIRDAAAMVRETDFAQRLVVGAVSGGIAAVVSCPMEVTVVRMSNDASLPAAERRGYTGLGDAFRRIVAEEGAATFFRGATPYVNRCMMVGACQVATYDQFKSMLAGAFAWARESPTKKAAVAALMSGYVYSVCTMPFEAAKNRMAFQKPDASGKLPYTGTLQTISKVATTEGATALYRGFSMYYVRCGGHTVISFLMLEELRRLYRVQTGT